MRQKSIAVLGGWAGAHMMTTDLTDCGYQVLFYEHPQIKESFRATLATFSLLADLFWRSGI